MKYYLIVSIFLFSIFFPFTGIAEDKCIFAVGFKGGTYENIAKSIKELSVFPFKIVRSRGSDEIINLVNSGDAEFGIAQLDVLLNAYNRKKRHVRNVKLVLPLYPEEIHLLASKKVKSINDLPGKQISVGPLDSGTAGTSIILLKNLGIGKSEIGKTHFMHTRNGLKSLQGGKIAALFISDLCLMIFSKMMRV